MENEERLQAMRDYAKKNNVPIIQDEGLNFLINLIRDNNIKTVLEIGTAIGYSAINMALNGANVSTIERDFDYYCEAHDNVKSFGLENKIQLIFSEAMLYNTSRQFDLLFIDGAKSQSINFFKKFRNCLHKGSFVLVDNINFHDYTYSDKPLSRDLREMTTKIKKYVEFIQADNSFESKIYNIGDGLCLSKLIAEK